MRLVLLSMSLHVGLAGIDAPAAPAPAAAPFELRWEAPSACPDRAAVRGAVERRLGRAIEGELGEGLVIDVRASMQSDGRWHVALDMHGAAGEAHRELSDASDCAAAVEAAALVIAIAIDPELAGVVPDAPPPETKPGEAVAAEEAKEDPQVEPRDPFAAAGAPIVTDAPPARPPRPPAWTRGAIGATAAISFGDLPVVGGHGRVFAALLRPRVRVELGGSFGGGPTVRRSNANGSASVTIRRWTIDARACPVVAPRPWLEILPCLGVEAGRTPVTTTGLTGPGRNHPWAALLAAPTVAFVPLRWLALRVGLELRVPVARRREYTITDQPDPVHADAPVAGALVAGIEARFP